MYYPRDLMRWSHSAERPFQPFGLPVSGRRSETQSLPETSREFTCLKHQAKNFLRSLCLRTIRSTVRTVVLVRQFGSLMLEAEAQRTLQRSDRI
jgi:hypothetical protein